jgi:hypothetical protein
VSCIITASSPPFTSTPEKSSSWKPSPALITARTAGKNHCETHRKKHHSRKFFEFPKNYAALCAVLMPRTIRDEIELENVAEIIDLMAAHRLTKDQALKHKPPPTGQ